MRIYPKPLQPGDRVMLFAPSFQASTEQIQRAHTQLESLQLHVENDLSDSVNDGYFAMSAEKVVEKIHAGFQNPNIKALISVRGGYGAARLLPYLDWALIQANPKVVLGFSDLTALLLAIYQKTGLVTFHGPTASREWSDATKKFLQDVLFCRKSVLFRNEDPETKTIALHHGEATGELFGGNLTVLNSLIGTDFLPTNWQNKILFIEDVNEDVYRIDRMLTHLKLAGILQALKGIIFGRFNQCSQKISNSFSLMEICTRATQDLHIPVLFDTMFGHQSHMFTLPIGAEIYLDSKKEEFHLQFAI